ncbi:hypothetical protein ABT052_40315 [Streptomyces sp. NPDC002766]|uniref:hypothetical protein n=1 Tax=Streptomyces sp. NPDC002766 TaxID=3154429 RepID=UPI00331E0A76
MPDRIQWRPIKKSVLVTRSPYRLPVAAVAVVVALIAVIALAGRDKSSPGTAADDKGGPSSTHTRQGVEDAATKAATAFGGERPFSDQGRRDLIQQLVAPDQRSRMLTAMDADYRPLARRIGLDSQGRPPAGAKFVSRTAAAGTTVRSYRTSRASVDVWCSTVFGLTGAKVKEIPMTSSWITMTVFLQWTDDSGWLVTKLTQRDGPEPSDAGTAAGRAPSA